MKSIVRAALVSSILAAVPTLAHTEIPGLDENGQCVGDADANHAVAINELILAVNNALGGCPRLPVTINFRGVVGDKAFACGQAYGGIGTGASQFIPADFRFYVSNVILTTLAGDDVPVELDQDGVWQYQNVALLDFETGPDAGCNEGNSATNTSLRGTVPAGVYTGIKFDVGLPFALNHSNASTAPSPLNFTALFWSWNQGYKFLRVDTADDKFRAHIGSTGCDGGSPSRPPTSCTRPNVGNIVLSGFDPAKDVIEADLAALLSDNNIDVNQANTAPGCQADPDDQDCAPVFRNLGLNFADGSPSPATQKFFRVAPEPTQSHVEIVVASSGEATGTLVAHPEFDVGAAIPLFFAECLGGSGDYCTGGTQLFSAANPGLEPLEVAEPEESLFPLAADTPVTLTVTALDAGLTLRLGDAQLDRVGAAVLLGDATEFHADLEAQIAIPGGQPPAGVFSMSFQLSTSSAQYQPSTIVTLKFAPSADAPSHQ